MWYKEQNMHLMEAINQSSGEAADKIKKRRQFLVYGIWLYFILLICEGGLRKWMFPSLATPLLIVRDPIAIGLMAYAWYNSMLPRSVFVNWMVAVSCLSFFATLFIGHGNLFVSVYGARLYLIHFPFVFLIGAILTRDDVLKFGRVILWITIPMAVLIFFQYYSPQSAWVNRGVGGDMAGAGFSGAMGFFRPPGTFSFTNGTTSFFSLAGAFIFYFWLRPGQVNKLILMAATAGLIMAIPFSISRMLAFTVVVMLFFVLLTTARNPKFFGKIFMGVVGVGILVMILGATQMLDGPVDVLMNRFDLAGRSEGGNLEGTIGNRYLGGMINAVLSAGDNPFFGVGLGLGTNAGASMVGQAGVFLVAEDEWPRIVGEMGAILGLGVIAIRLIISAKLALASYINIRNGDVLSWMLLSFMLLIFPQGQWAQPTTLGFSTLIAGLLIASFNSGVENLQEIKPVQQ